MSDKYCYSTNQERYYGEYGSREEALEAARDDGGEGTIWTGLAVTPDPADWIGAEDIIEHIQCQDDFAGEHAEDWPGETVAQRNELTEAVIEVFNQWMDRHGLRPKFFNAVDIQEHKPE